MARSPINMRALCRALGWRWSRDIVVLGSPSAEDMEREVFFYHPDWSDRHPHVRLRFYSGSPREYSDLSRVSVRTDRHVAISVGGG